MDTTPYWFHSAELPQFPSISEDVRVDVAIVGGGLTGITAAYLLKREGIKVALLERGRCARADTGHTTAHLTYVTDERLHELVDSFGKDCAQSFWEAGAAAIDQIFDNVRNEQIRCEFDWVPGYLHVALREPAGNEHELLHRDAELANELGFHAQFIDAVPYANRAGVRFPKQAKFHPRKYLSALLGRIHGDGSFVFENSEVTEFEDEPLRLKVGSHVVHCQLAFIATHTPLMGNTGMVNATLFQSKLAPYTSYVLGARLPHGSVPEALFWDTGDPYYYLRVDRHQDHDYAIFGGEDCKTGQEKDPAEHFRHLEEVLKSVLPMAEVRDRWCGQVIETNDGLPYIGSTADNQFVATGFCGNGFTLGTVAAMMARDFYLRRRNPWFGLFNVNRKKVIGGGWRYVRENLDYPYYMVRDRFAKAEADSLENVRAGEGKIVNLDGKKVAAYRDPRGDLTLLSPVCTHMKCIVGWNDADHTWDCPCHGSRFKPTGEVIGGPAETPEVIGGPAETPLENLQREKEPNFTPQE
jgi:glycine/D-amino acid oxidase-like deaminating enzyme/nitrite reductase/ring-hydroxylating ferredoxin subunit